MDEKLAIFGGKPMREKPFQPHPLIGEEEIKAVNDVLRSGKLSTFHSNFMGGERIRWFEKSFAEYLDVKYAIAVNSGTAALHASVAAIGVQPGDEVIVPSYTFTGTATSVLMHNAIPVFADVDYETYDIDPEKIEAAITPHTKAIIPVHLLGNPAEMDAIMEIARKHKLKIIEDSAQAPGAKYKDKFTGVIGDLGIFSFQETKNMMTGEGGMIVTNDKGLAERCSMIRNHGEMATFGKPREYLSNILGWNYRMTEIEAAIGIEQLKKLDKGNDIRIKNSMFLTEKLRKIRGFYPQKVVPHAKHIYHLYGMVIDEEEINIPRNIFVKALDAEGIPASTGYPRPLYENPLFKERVVYGNNGCPFTCKFYKGNVEYKAGMCPVTEKLCKTAVWLPIIRPPATLEDMRDVIGAIKKIINNSEQLKEMH
jgi:dTDP-4-amino-4,6-dideoxygalactose transaminase